MGAQLSACLILGLALAASAQARYAITDEDPMGEGSPKVVVLHDTVAGAEAAITPSSGAEISNFKVTRQGKMIELLYNARDYASPPGVFHGRGPLLWPAVGMQYPVTTVPKENCGMGSYIVAGKSYPMPCHGFSKGMRWREIARSADSHGARVTVELKDPSGDRRWVALMLMSQCRIQESTILTFDGSVRHDCSPKEPLIRTKRVW